MQVVCVDVVIDIDQCCNQLFLGSWLPSCYGSTTESRTKKRLSFHPKSIGSGFEPKEYPFSRD